MSVSKVRATPRTPRFTRRPAQAGTQPIHLQHDLDPKDRRDRSSWIPAHAGMTSLGSVEPPHLVAPAQAGTQPHHPRHNLDPKDHRDRPSWIPTYSGITSQGAYRLASTKPPRDPRAYSSRSPFFTAFTMRPKSRSFLRLSA